jgi:hypothetical protein
LRKVRTFYAIETAAMASPKAQVSAGSLTERPETGKPQFRNKLSQCSNYPTNGRSARSNRMGFSFAHPAAMSRRDESGQQRILMSDGEGRTSRNA